MSFKRVFYFINFLLFLAGVFYLVKNTLEFRQYKMPVLLDIVKETAGGEDVSDERILLKNNSLETIKKNPVLKSKLYNMVRKHNLENQKIMMTDIVDSNYFLLGIISLILGLFMFIFYQVDGNVHGVFESSLVLNIVVVLSLMYQEGFKDSVIFTVPTKTLVCYRNQLPEVFHEKDPVKFQTSFKWHTVSVPKKIENNY